MVFLEGYYQPLLLGHLAITFILVGSTGHNVRLCIGNLRGRYAPKQQQQFFAAVAFWSYLAVYVLGSLIYPAFRVYMRHEYFDLSMRWATGLFEVKEHWGAIGLAILAFYYALSRDLEPKREKGKLLLYTALCFLTAVIIGYEVIVGAILAHLKGAF